MKQLLYHLASLAMFTVALVSMNLCLKEIAERGSNGGLYGLMFVLSFAAASIFGLLSTRFTKNKNEKRR